MLYTILTTILTILALLVVITTLFSLPFAVGTLAAVLLSEQAQIRHKLQIFNTCVEG